jgi:hypothetical protein
LTYLGWQRSGRLATFHVKRTGRRQLNRLERGPL